VRSENTDVRVPWEGKHYIVSFKLLSTMEKKLVDEQHSGAPPPLLSTVTSRPGLRLMHL
jgi:hypothetical protein